MKRSILINANERRVFLLHQDEKFKRLKNFVEKYLYAKVKVAYFYTNGNLVLRFI